MGLSTYTLSQDIHTPIYPQFTSPMSNYPQFLRYNIFPSKMGNCTGTNANPKSKPIKSLGKNNLQDQQNQPPTLAALTPRSKISFQEATRKREALRLNLMEQSLDPPTYFVHKIEPLSKMYTK